MWRERDEGGKMKGGNGGGEIKRKGWRESDGGRVWRDEDKESGQSPDAAPENKPQDSSGVGGTYSGSSSTPGPWGFPWLSSSPCCHLRVQLRASGISRGPALLSKCSNQANWLGLNQALLLFL